MRIQLKTPEQVKNSSTSGLFLLCAGSYAVKNYNGNSCVMVVMGVEYIITENKVRVCPFEMCSFINSRNTKLP